MMTEKVPFVKIFTNSLFVTGMTIGAGILALPIKTGMAGLIPSILTVFVVWLFMLATATVFIYKFTHPKERSRDYPTLFQTEIGPKGKWVSVLGYLVNYYGILVAYLTGSAAILGTLAPGCLPDRAWMLMVFVVLTGLALMGADRAKNANAVIMIAMVGSFLALLFLAGKHIDVTRYAYRDWSVVTSIIPIMIVAFSFHNVIPVVCRNLNGDQNAAFKAVLLGSSIATGMNLLWITVVMGALPLSGPGNATILSALQNDYPATIPLALALNSRIITGAGMFFALAAIATSYIPTGVALTGFMRGLLALRYKEPAGYAILLLSFGPPFLVAMVYPGLFLKAIDVAGGFGIVVVFGILPGIIMVKMAKDRGSLFRTAAFIVMIFFTMLLACETAQEAGFLKIGAEQEYWSSK